MQLYIDGTLHPLPGWTSSFLSDPEHPNPRVGDFVAKLSGELARNGRWLCEVQPETDVLLCRVAVVEVVTINSETQVQWQGQAFNAVLPVKTDGFADFAVGASVIAGWEHISKRFFVCNHRPLDFDFIADHLAEEYGFERGEGLGTE